MSNQPSPAGDNGRNPDGTSAKGNRAACGNPFAQRVAKLRTALLNAVSDDDIRAIVAAMVKQAKAGDMVAAREVLTCVVGKPTDAVDPDRVEIDGKQIERELDESNGILRLDF